MSGRGPAHLTPVRASIIVDLVMYATPPQPPASGLSVRHARFVDLIIEGRSQTEAYVECGYSPVNAAANASRLVNSPKIKSEVHRRRQDAAARADFTIDQALRVLSDIATDPEASDGDKIRASVEFSKMAGEHPGQRIHHTGNIVNTTISVSDAINMALSPASGAMSLLDEGIEAKLLDIESGNGK